MRTILSSARFPNQKCNVLVHKTCVGIDVDIKQLEVWFCDLCLYLEKERVLRQKGASKRTLLSPPTQPRPPSSDSHGSDEAELNGNHCEESSDSNSLLKRIKKRRKNKFYNEKKSKKKRQMQISAFLTAQVLQQTKQKNREPTYPTDYNWQEVEGVRCVFCRLPYGVFMKLDKPANTWGHLSCGYWLSYTNPYMPDRLIYLNARGCRELGLSATVPCAYCRNREGILAECFFKGCGVRFHVECGRRSFCELKFPYQLRVKQKEHVVFCFHHSQTFNARRIEQTIETEWGQMKNVLKSFRNHHNNTLHFDLAGSIRKIRPKRLVIQLKRVSCGRVGVGFAYVDSLQE